jgi:hypothetical protein
MMAAQMLFGGLSPGKLLFCIYDLSIIVPPNLCWQQILPLQALEAWTTPSSHRSSR